MRDTEARFFDRIYADGPDAVVEAVEAGITTEHFADPDLGRAWDYIADYADEHQMLPSVDDVCFETGTDFEVFEPEDALGRIIDLLKQARSYGLYKQTVAEANKVVKADPAAAWALVSQGYEQAAAEKGVLKPVEVHADWGLWLDGFMQEEGLIGIPTGFPTIDYATSGLQDEQLITLVGPPKGGKSTLMLRIAMEANIRYNKRVLFCTFEMTAEEQRRRLACMIAGVDYQRFLQKRLSPKELAEMRRALERYEEVTADFIFATDITAGSTVGAVTAQVRKYDPHVVFVDGVYLMDSEVPGVESMDPKALTALTRNLKRATQRTSKPFVISHQILESRYSARRGIKSKDIGYSSSFAQDSDVILGVEPTENEMERRLSIVLARNAAQRSTMLAWDWETSSMEEIEGYSESDFDFDDGPGGDDDDDA